ncbi:MAG: hypothetical protein V3V00_01695 [Saprospiraceae bacterium]
MKNYILLTIIFIGFLSCGKDDGDLSTNMLRYDGDNATSPIFPVGDHEAAARFPSFVTNEFIGKQLTGVEVFIYNVPSSIFLNIYDSGSAVGPNIPIIRVDITNSLTPNRMNLLEFSAPLDVTTEMWISISWTQNIEEQVMGCDAGPANTNGDWVFLSTDMQGWSSFRQRTGESINWNIRGIVTDK